MSIQSGKTLDTLQYKHENWNVCIPYYGICWARSHRQPDRVQLPL